MGQNKVNIIQGDGGLGQQLPSEDHVSALLFEHAMPPSTWEADEYMRSFRSVKTLEDSGILEHDLQYGKVHYQVKEFFRAHPQGEVYVGFRVLQGSTALAIAETIKSYTLGRVRQFGLFLDSHLYTTGIQEMLDALESLEMDAVAIMGLEENIYFNSIPNLAARTHKKVHVLIAGDGAGLGASYADALGITYIPAVGTALGTLAASKVHESFAYVRKYNISNGTEMEEPIFCNGTLLKNTAKAYLDELHDKGWGFARKHQGVVGSYFDDNHTCIALSSDYSSLNINRTSQKAVRGVRAELNLELSGDVEIDGTTGNLSIGYIEYLKTLASQPLSNMEKAGELSRDGYSVVIDPTQDFLQTSNLLVTIKLVPKGVSRNITINLGFALRIA